MAEMKNPPKKKNIVVRPAPPVLKIVVCLLILASIAALIALRWVHNGIQEETRNLTEQAAGLEYENSDLQDKIDSAGSVQSVQDIAREELGLIDPDTVVIEPED